MRRFFKKIKLMLPRLGIHIPKFIFFIKGLPGYFRDFRALSRQLKGNPDFKIEELCPVLYDKFLESGEISGHYFQQDLLVASRVYKNNPNKHVDIGSSVSSFVAHVASFREIEVFDIRPQLQKIKNIIFVQTDMMALPKDMVDYCDSLSSLHAIEHFGLGRYGDPIDANGHIKALNNIYKILKKNGKFYLSVPIGNQRIEFNTHRIFGIKYLLDIFKDKYKVDSFSFIDDKGCFFENAGLKDEDIRSNFNCNYGCGIFEMTKL